MHLIKVVECLFPLKWIDQVHFLLNFSGRLHRLGNLSKDPIVWQGVARLANTYIPPSFPGNVPTQLHSIPMLKIHFASTWNISKIWWNHFFNLKNQRESLIDSRLATMSLIKVKLATFTSLSNLESAVNWSKLCRCHIFLRGNCSKSNKQTFWAKFQVTAVNLFIIKSGANVIKL